MRQLVVNADDFGFTRGVNDGIARAHREGILTATTLMATGAAFDHAVALAGETPTLDIGCHLVLVGGPGMPATVAELVRAVALGRIRVYEELWRQVKRILHAGVAPTHLDTHKHTHLLPPVLDAVARISEETGIRWVRRPFDFPMHVGGTPLAARAANRAFGLVRGRLTRVLKKRGCLMTENFAGFRLTGRFGAAEVAELIRALPEGTTEFMCHPGICTEELRAARTRLKESRERELEALVAPEVRKALEESGVALVSYRDLPRAEAG